MVFLKKHLTSINKKKGKGLIILTTKLMLQGLPIALAQLNTNNTSEKLLNQNPSNHIFFCIEQKKSLNKYIAI